MKKEMEMKIPDLSNCFSDILDIMYGNKWTNDPNFKETPLRIAKAWAELLCYEDDAARILAIEECVKKIFPTKHEDLIFAPNIIAFSMCPHHFLPVEYNITIGYIPNKEGKEAYAIGSSKLERISRILAARAIIQEDLTHEIADILQTSLRTSSVAVLTSGTHGCMRCRGIRGHGTFEISTLRGAFKENEATRMEFLLLQKRYR